MKALLFVTASFIFTASLLCFIMCAIDKSSAKRNRRRIAERHFFLMALSGGGPGLWLGMLCFRHKTRHWYFWVIAVSCTLCQLALLVWVGLKTTGSV